MNTALGNCLLMIIMITTYLFSLMIKYDILDDGDDALVIVERRDYPLFMAGLKAAFLSYGHEIKVENIAFTPEGVEWCQCKPVEVSPSSYVFVRDWRKVFSGSLCSAKHTHFGVKARSRHMLSVGQGELVLSLGVPVLQAYACALIRNAGDVRPSVLTPEMGLYWRVRHEIKGTKLTLARVQPLVITPTARLSFFKAYGMDVGVQLALEKYLETWTLDIKGANDMGKRIDVASWSTSCHDSSECYAL
jgi:hypothetical protein